jgi:hypothetical protein
MVPRMVPLRTRALSALVAITATAALAAGCGGDDDDSDASAPSTTASTNEGEAVAVSAIDYEFEDLPQSIAAGARLTLHNDSEAELHELVAFRLADDETRSAEELAQLPEAELEAVFAGEPATVLIAKPGEESTAALGDGSLTEPGRYVVFCAIPQGVDPDEYLAAAEQSEEGPPDLGGGPPHFLLGMVGEVTVE